MAIGGATGPSPRCVRRDTSTAVGLEQTQKPVNGSSALRRRKTQAPARVDEYMIEFESPRGPKMRIHWNPWSPLDWEALLRAWRKVQR